MTVPSTHLIIIPSYNPGPRLLNTVKGALMHWPTIWVVVDGGTDESEHAVEELCASHPGLRVLRREINGGKGAAVLTGALAAREAGFTHALVMDADGQHPASHIREFIEASIRQPDHLILGEPIFGPEAPLERLQGRKLSVGLVHFETFGNAIADPLFGFRVYPLPSLIAALGDTRFARGFDFDPEVAVRIVWAGVPTINLPAPCCYLRKSDGGVSHFHYLRDNVKMVWLHTRLITQLLLWRWPAVRRLQLRRQ